MNFLELITPTNLEVEKKKFFSDPAYNATFQYIWEGTPHTIPKDTPKSKATLLKAIFKQDHERITATAQKQFQTNLEEYNEEAEQTILKFQNTKDSKPPIKDISEKQICEKFQEAFEYFELDYKFNISAETGFSFRPKPFTKELVMSRVANFQFFTIEGEIRHELAHILRYENSKYNKIETEFDYLPTEEGLATYLQDSTAGNNYSEFQHAGEYLAGRVGKDGSLRNIYDFLIGIGFNKELAWQRSIRHKFGFKDTSIPGDIIKPAMYFLHSKRIAELSPRELLILFSGKISINSINKYSGYKGLFPEEKIRAFYSIKE